MYPALAVASALAARGYEVAFVGTPDGIERKLAADAGLEYVPVRAKGFDRASPVSLLFAAVTLAGSFVRCFALLGRLRPAVVVGFGGFVSMPLGLAAAVRKIPLVIHEQNSVLGLANRVLARYATSIALTYPLDEGSLRATSPIVLTGNPVRQQVLGADREKGRATLGVPFDCLLLLVFGGSRGARHINQAMAALASEILAHDDVWVIHVAGRAEFADVAASLEHVDRERYRVVDYIDDMGSALAAADFVVARAGATSIAEITAVGRAAILVPYPFATDDHQAKNAQTLTDAGAAEAVADSDLDTDVFRDKLLALMTDPDLLARMSAKSRQLSRPDAGESVAALADSAAKGAATHR